MDKDDEAVKDMYPGVFEKKHERTETIAAKHVEGYYKDGTTSLFDHMYACCKETEEWKDKCLESAFEQVGLMHADEENVVNALDELDELLRRYEREK